MIKALITGGSGFFGNILIKHLLKEGWECINFDIIPNNYIDTNLINIKGDIRSKKDLFECFSQNKIDVVFHCAALLAHGKIDKQDLMNTNAAGTRNLAEIASISGIKNFIYISSNCLWGEGKSYPISEDDLPEPCDNYGKSKLEGELILKEFHQLNPKILRVPTLIDEGRLGLLGLLFDFIADNKRCWVVGDGSNKYQFLYARDLATACLSCYGRKNYEIFHLGSDNVRSLREVYQHVINNSNSKSKISKMPRRLTVLMMKIFYKLGLSPLGPYHWGMIAESFQFDTTKAKNKLNWTPTLSNEEILLKAYKYYIRNRNEILSRENVSAHNSVSKAGIISLLKFIS